MARNFLVLIAIIALLTPVASLAQTNTRANPIIPLSIFKTNNDSTSYAIGVNIGTNFKSQDLKINISGLLAGIMDAMSTNSSAVKLTDDQMEQLFARLQEAMSEKQSKQNEIQSRENMAKAQAFLAENARKSGVITTESGLQYRVIRRGTGVTPTESSQVVVHYRGKLLDGTVFDSSYDRNEPATFQVDQVIQGWIEGLQLMSAGAVYELFIPANLAYGEQGNPVIPPGSLLIFEVELIEVKN